MKNWKHPKRLPVYLAIAALISGCGSTAATSFGNSPTAGGGLTGGNIGGIGGSGSSSGSGSGSGSTSTTSPSTTSAPALSFSNFSMSGQGGVNPVYSTKSTNGSYINTDNVLKVRVTVQPGSSVLQSPSGQYSGFSANYSCVSYQVSIYDDSGTEIGSQSTQMLQVPGQPPCPNSTQTSYQDLDFSGSVQSPHGGIDVRVQPLQYDWYCRLWYDNYSMYGALSPYYGLYSYWCPGKAVYKNHEVNGSIEVQVNGTAFF